MSTWTCTLENVHLDLHPRKCPLGLAPAKKSSWQVWREGCSALVEAIATTPTAHWGSMQLHRATLQSRDFHKRVILVPTPPPAPPPPPIFWLYRLMYNWYTGTDLDTWQVWEGGRSALGQAVGHAPSLHVYTLCNTIKSNIQIPTIQRIHTITTHIYILTFKNLITFEIH